eukprot:TRINITY_DN34279_c0_g2_i1.p1 TRINITY_DN34279_c0_g2~~TRINITY_DN34279_c0_g2_i1.p1  ORF type:complete len:356 (-),score=7.87 TRINITY_DN34279_c0_g2_i1:386-1453(-)
MQPSHTGLTCSRLLTVADLQSHKTQHKHSVQPPPSTTMTRVNPDAPDEDQDSGSAQKKQKTSTADNAEESGSTSEAKKDSVIVMKFPPNPFVQLASAAKSKEACESTYPLATLKKRRCKPAATRRRKKIRRGQVKEETTNAHRTPYPDYWWNTHCFTGNWETDKNVGYPVKLARHCSNKAVLLKNVHMYSTFPSCKAGVPDGVLLRSVLHTTEPPAAEVILAAIAKLTKLLEELQEENLITKVGDSLWKPMAPEQALPSYEELVMKESVRMITRPSDYKVALVSWFEDYIPKLTEQEEKQCENFTSWHAPKTLPVCASCAGPITSYGCRPDRCLWVHLRETNPEKGKDVKKVIRH